MHQITLPKHLNYFTFYIFPLENFYTFKFCTLDLLYYFFITIILRILIYL